MTLRVQYGFMDADRRRTSASRSSSVRSFRDLDCWRLAVDLRRRCDHIAARLPSRDRFGLGDQLRCASASIPANIAEGHGRGTRGEFLRFLSIARGSLMEVENHLLQVADAGATTELRDALALCRRLGKVMSALTRALRNGRSK